MVYLSSARKTGVVIAATSYAGRFKGLIINSPVTHENIPGNIQLASTGFDIADRVAQALRI